MVSHRVRGRKFGRKTKHRIALKRNLVSSLIEHGRIVTTLPKAKEYRPYAEKVISLGRVKTLHNVRQAAKQLSTKAVVRKLFDEVGPRFRERPGGYTRIRRLAKPRLNDGAPRAILELVDYEPAKAAPQSGETAAAAEPEETAETARKSGKGKKGKKAKAAAAE